MNTRIVKRAICTARFNIRNDRRPVSEMNDDQRKAVMAKLGGGGGGGYSGGARGGGSPMRKQRAQFSRLSQEMELRRQGQTGLQSALTPVELLMSTGLEAGLDSLNQARESTDNRMIDLALGAAGMALVAAGFRNGLKNINQAIAAKAAVTRKNVEAIFEQMASDAARFGQIAPAKAATIPRSVSGDAFRAEAIKHTGSMRGMYLDYARRADMEAVSPRMVRDPWTSTREVIPRLLDNAVRTAKLVYFANAPRGTMTEEQRRAMFAGMGGRGGGAYKPGPNHRNPVGPSVRGDFPHGFAASEPSTSPTAKGAWRLDTPGGRLNFERSLPPGMPNPLPTNGLPVPMPPGGNVMWPGGTPPWIFDERIGGPNPNYQYPQPVMAQPAAPRHWSAADLPTLKRLAVVDRANANQYNHLIRVLEAPMRLHEQATRGQLPSITPAMTRAVQRLNR